MEVIVLIDEFLLVVSIQVLDLFCFLLCGQFIGEGEVGDDFEDASDEEDEKTDENDRGDCTDEVDGACGFEEVYAGVLSDAGVAFTKVDCGEDVEDPADDKGEDDTAEYGGKVVHETGEIGDLCAFEGSDPSEAADSEEGDDHDGDYGDDGDNAKDEVIEVVIKDGFIFGDVGNVFDGDEDKDQADDADKWSGDGDEAYKHKDGTDATHEFSIS